MSHPDQNVLQQRFEYILRIIEEHHKKWEGSPEPWRVWPNISDILKRTQNSNLFKGKDPRDTIQLMLDMDIIARTRLKDHHAWQYLPMIKQERTHAVSDE